MRLITALVFAALLSLPLTVASPMPDETWVGNATAIEGVESGTTRCETVVRFEIRETGTTFSMNSYNMRWWDAGPCEVPSWIVHPWKEEHALPADSGTPHTGYASTWSVPANCATGTYIFTLETGPLGLDTPFRFVREGTCNGHPFHYEVSGTVDFVAYVGMPVG